MSFMYRVYEVLGVVKEVRGKVIRVFGDIVSVAVDDETLHIMGIRGTYVKIKTGKNRDLLGIVSNLNLLDELYRQSSGRISILESYSEISLTRNEIIVSLLGSLTDNGIDRKIDTIPSPGDDVYPLTTDELSRIFSRGDIRIGSLTTNANVEVKLDINELATKHAAILAMTGAGKSNALGVLLIQILKRFDHARILLIDTHSEYVILGGEKSPIRDKTIVYAPVGKFKQILEKDGVNALSLETPYWMLTLEEWYSLLGLTPQATRQRRSFREALRNIKGERRLNDPIYFDLRELYSAIRSTGNEELIEKFEDAINTEEYEFIFYPKETTEILKRDDISSEEKIKMVFKKISEPIIRDGLKIIALGGLSADVQNSVVSMLLRTLFRIAVEAKLAGHPIPAIIAVEEAHIYAPKDMYATAKQIIERIAKEGRKFGIGLLLVSQRPRELSETALAQCGTLIALKTVNPSDQKHIQNSLEDVTSMITSSLPGLGRGEAIISGPSVPVPCVVKVDLFDEAIEREFNERLGLGGKDIDFREEWMNGLKDEVIEEIFKRIYSVKRDERERIKSKGSLDEFFNR